jgi:hypothetical protein
LLPLSWIHPPASSTRSSTAPTGHPWGPLRERLKSRGWSCEGAGKAAFFQHHPGWIALESGFCAQHPRQRCFFGTTPPKTAYETPARAIPKDPPYIRYAWHAEVVCNHLYAYRWCFVIIACMHTWSGINYNHDACMPRCVFIIYLLLMSYLLVLFIFNYSFIFIFPFFLSILFIYFICSWFSLFLLLFSRNSSLSLIYF